MPSPDMEKQFFSMLAEGEAATERAPSSMKARLYSQLIHQQQESGRLASLDASVEAGHGICVFERLVQIAPIGEPAKSPFFCQVCHARVLAEHFDNPPIFWPHCPYVKFKES
ncbi:MAG TPA: hypothetical protein VF133_13215 [Terriglobales bacterium]